MDSLYYLQQVLSERVVVGNPSQLDKPITPEQLISFIDEAMTRKEAQDESDSRCAFLSEDSDGY